MREISIKRRCRRPRGGHPARYALKGPAGWGGAYQRGRAGRCCFRSGGQTTVRTVLLSALSVEGSRRQARAVELEEVLDQRYRSSGGLLMRILVLAVLGLLSYPNAGATQGHDDLLCKPTLAPRAAGPQVADDNFNPAVPNPAFASGSGPLVLLDEGHSNFHTVDGRYSPFVRILRRDGFRVEPARGRFTPQLLAPARILVIANAAVPRKQGDPYIPSPSAFTQEEVDVVRRWVSSGGSLLLIADHQPWGGEA